jgi:hypothetical protein
MKEAGVPGRVIVLHADLRGLVTGEAARLPDLVDAEGEGNGNGNGNGNGGPVDPWHAPRDSGSAGVFDFDTDS